jgi:hypothetical protein
VVRTYDALEQLTGVLSTICEGPKSNAESVRRPKERSAAGRKVKSAKEVFEEDEALSLDYRVSPFITEGNRKGTVSIDGTVWPRFV